MMFLLFLCVLQSVFGEVVESYHLFEANTLHRNLNYNLGDLLNMPSFSGQYKWPKNNKVKKTRAFNVSQSAKLSILGYYFSKYDDIDNSELILDDSRYPNVTHMLRSVKEYGFHAKKLSPPILHLDDVQRSDTLLVHIRSGDFGGIGPNYTTAVLETAAKYQHTILMSGVHNDTRWGMQMNASAKILTREMTKLTAALNAKKINSTIHYGTNPDDDMYLMSKAANLIVHRGGYSILGAIVCPGNVYITKDLLYYQLTDEFKALVRKPHYLW